MASIQVKLDSIDSVKSFVNIVSQSEYEVDITSGRYTVDAKNIMAIFSLDLSKPLTVDIHADAPDAQALLDELQQFTP